MLLNNSSSLIPSQKIQAPLISKDSFIDMFVDYAKIQTTVDEVDLSDTLNSNSGFIELNPVVFDDMPMNEYICTEHVFITNDEVMDETNSSFSTIIGLHFTSQGVPFLGYLAGTDESLECFRLVYYADNEFKIYTPRYGNCWNITEGNAMYSESSDPEDDDDYCDSWGTDSTTVQNAPLYQLIDEAAIMQEIEAVFVAGPQLQNPTFNLPTGGQNSNPGNNNSGNSSSNNNSNSTPQSSPKKKSTMDVLYDVFSKKAFQMIPPLQQSLISQGETTYDKSKCFKDLKNRDAFQKDIYNYILQFNNMDTVPNKIIECTKIALYINRYRFYHEGLVL